MEKLERGAIWSLLFPPSRSTGFNRRDQKQGPEPGGVQQRMAAQLAQPVCRRQCTHLPLKPTQCDTRHHGSTHPYKTMREAKPALSVAQATAWSASTPAHHPNLQENRVFRPFWKQMNFQGI